MNYFNISGVEDFFERKFSFCPENNWNLPEVHVINSEETWSIENFQKLKKDLNDAKSLLNDKGEQWQQHTFYTNKAQLVVPTLRNKIQTDLLTQAWCKFYEILSSYRLVPNEARSYNSLHLCEAPGAFISALNYYLTANHHDISWNWYANSLNPYYEGQSIKNVIVDDRFLLPTLRHWYFGRNNTGDITDPSFFMNLSSFLEETGLFDLVTADGSFSCLDNPAEQETVVAELQFYEMLIALSCLEVGATFVIKKFTFFECITICKMYFLNCTFKEVHVFKPFTSKAGNSEVYVVCIGYLGAEKVDEYLKQLSKTYLSEKNKAIFPINILPSSFLKQLFECAETFMEFQKRAILENIDLYSIELSNYKQALENFQTLAAVRFMEKYGISSDVIPKRLTSSKKQVMTSIHGKKYGSCKSQYFLALGETFDNIKKSFSMTWRDELLDVEKRLNSCFLKNKKRPHDEIEWYFVWNEVFNRMKTKNYRRWMLTGKKIELVKNSKFCNPLLLHLWNRISYADEVQMKNHTVGTHIHWDIQSVLSLLIESRNAENVCLVPISRIQGQSKIDPLLHELLKTFQKSIEIDVSETQKSYEAVISERNKIMYVNSSCWVENLNPELQIKHSLTNCIKHIFQVLQEGDSVLLCLQTLLTRYTVGLLYLLISLFEKFVCILPNSSAPAACGQLWILKNCKRQNLASRIKEYLDYIENMEVSEEYEILEIVPIAALCGKFFEYLLPLNNDYLIQKILSLTSVEKMLLQDSI